MVRVLMPSEGDVPVVLHEDGDEDMGIGAEAEEATIWLPYPNHQQYTSPQPQGYPNVANTTPYTAANPYAHPAATPGSSYQRQPGYDAAYAPPPSTTQSTSTYAPVMPNPPHTQPAPPPMMGPPMRWGFEQGNANPAGSYAGAQRNQRGPRPFNAYGGPTPTGGHQMHHANKRDHKSAFGKPQSIGPRVPAPPPVPSFGNPLPSKPPPPADAARKPKKKKRKHNQLGLTPKTEEHESSEEEDDVDEESKFAQGGAAAAALQITYRGRTSTLQSPEDIAAWIEERKKRFPTQARIEERKKAMEEAKKAREEAARQREQRRQETKRAQKEQANDGANPMDEAAKAKQRADKLRRKLQKEQKRVEKAEADAERARMKVEELQKAASAQAQPGGSGSDVAPQGVETTDAVSTDTANVVPSKDAVEDDAALSSHASESSDWTSSSGSDTSSDSDDSDDDSAPEEATSRREGPERVAPPARESKKRICRHFLRTGRCLRGDNCKFLHEKPERPVKQKAAEKPGRKGLLQALLGRQKEDEDRRAMEVIVWLGENGLLEKTESGDSAPATEAQHDNSETQQPVG
ncbi:hypothetical protein ATERTT37_002008 [Aspergillus terreus]